MNGGHTNTAELLPFGDLIAHLERNGFRISPEHHVRLRALLNSFAGAYSPSDLKTLMCPLFATTDEHQEFFYQAFDACYPFLGVTGLPSRHAEDQADGTDFFPTTPKRKWPLLVAALSALAVVLALLIWVTGQPPTSPRKLDEKQGQGEKGAKDSGPDSLKVKDTNAGSLKDNARGSMSQPVEPPSAKDPASTVDTSLEIDRLPAPESKWLASYWQHRELWTWSAVMAPLIGGLFWEWFRFRKRHHLIRKARGKRPPYSWPVHTEAISEVYDPHELASVSRLLHRRHQGESERLDIAATVAASVDALGFPTFKYQRDSRLPEYLFLIDRSGFRDHQSKLYEHLASLLRANDLFVSVYFYEGDPRVCWRAISNEQTYLEHLQHTYAGHRLLLFGDGEMLLDAVTGRLVSWHRLFESWPDRAVLTPQPPSEWNVREMTLTGQFAVLPGTLDGLEMLAAYFELPSSLSKAIPGSDDGPTTTGTVESMDALRRYLGEQVFQWLCACAVYPELHWDLTLNLGRLPSMPRDLVGEKNLVKLLPLPWFRKGAMPDELRRLLIAELNPQLQREVREVIIGALESSSPPAHTFASSARSFQIAYQRYWLNPADRKVRRALKTAMENLAPGEVDEDYAYLDAAELVTSPLQFLLPKRLRRIVYSTGTQWLGMRTAIRFLGFAALAGVALLATGWTTSWLGNRALVREVVATDQELPVMGPGQAPKVSLQQLKQLDRQRQILQKLTAWERNGAPMSMRWGLYEGHDLYARSYKAYFETFRRMLLRPTQDTLTRFMSRPATAELQGYRPVYDALKAYLITTSNPDKSTQDFLVPVLMEHWQSRNQADEDRQTLVRRQFSFYAAELPFQNPFPGSNPDQTAVTSARSYLARFAATEALYSAMVSAASASKPAFDFNKAYPGSSDVVANTYLVPGAFTRDGFGFMQNAIQHPDQYFQGEAWVLGPQTIGRVDRTQLQHDLQEKYRADFLMYWREFLQHTSVVRFGSVPDAAGKLTKLSGNASPLLGALCAVSRNTSVDDPEIAKAFQAPQQVEPAACNDRLASPGNMGYVSGLITLQAALQQLAENRNDTAAQSQATSAASAALVTVRQMASQFSIDKEGGVSAKTQGLLEEPIKSAQALIGGVPRDGVNSGAQGFCSQYRSLISKYPFDPKASARATQSEFDAIFKLGDGALWKLYNSTLNKLLVKQGAEYAANPGGGMTVTPQFLSFFNRAAAISDAFYRNGSPTANLTFTLKPVPSEAVVQEITLIIDGKTATFKNGKGDPQQFSWPGTGAQEVKLKVRFAGGSEFDMVTYTEAWAAFSFFLQAERWQVSGNQQTMEWTARSATGPMIIGGKPATVRFTLDMGGGPAIFQPGFWSSAPCPGAAVQTSSTDSPQQIVSPNVAAEKARQEQQRREELRRKLGFK